MQPRPGRPAGVTAGVRQSILSSSPSSSSPGTGKKLPQSKSWLIGSTPSPEAAAAAAAALTLPSLGARQGAFSREPHAGDFDYGMNVEDILPPSPLPAAAPAPTAAPVAPVASATPRPIVRVPLARTSATAPAPAPTSSADHAESSLPLTSAQLSAPATSRQVSRGAANSPRTPHASAAATTPPSTGSPRGDAMLAAERARSGALAAEVDVLATTVQRLLAERAAVERSTIAAAVEKALAAERTTWEAAVSAAVAREAAAASAAAAAERALADERAANEAAAAGAIAREAAVAKAIEQATAALRERELEAEGLREALKAGPAFEAREAELTAREAELRAQIVALQESMPKSVQEVAVDASADSNLSSKHSLAAFVADLRAAGLASSQLVLHVDCTKSNLDNGAVSFDKRSLHDISPGAPANPYVQVMRALGGVCEELDDDGLIPLFGFGDRASGDSSVFDFAPETPVGLAGVLAAYTARIGSVDLAGPTSFAPSIRKTMELVRAAAKRTANGAQTLHICVIIADGQVNTLRDTVKAINDASRLPIAIVCVGVGDGPWKEMNLFDNNCECSVCVRACVCVWAMWLSRRTAVPLRRSVNAPQRQCHCGADFRHLSPPYVTPPAWPVLQCR